MELRKYLQFYAERFVYLNQCFSRFVRFIPIMEFLNEG